MQCINKSVHGPTAFSGGTTGPKMFDETAQNSSRSTRKGPNVEAQKDPTKLTQKNNIRRVHELLQ